MNTIRHDENRAATRTLSNIGFGCASLLALLSASCCILPLGLTIVGLGGAWLSLLEPFVAYRELILTAASGIVAYLWLRVWKTKGTIVRQRRGIAMAGMAFLVTALAWTAPAWEWKVSKLLMEIWMNQQ